MFVLFLKLKQQKMLAKQNENADRSNNNFKILDSLGMKKDDGFYSDLPDDEDEDDEDEDIIALELDEEIDDDDESVADAEDITVEFEDDTDEGDDDIEQGEDLTIEADEYEEDDDDE